MIIKPPHRHYTIGHSVFLAGSIEMGQAEDWQTKVSNALDKPGTVIYNPRRDDWDDSWKQEITNPQFVEQVEWELDMLTESRLKLFYFHPETKSPITLMELGIAGSSLNQIVDNPQFMIVCCPKGFWRKGNVDIVCKRFGLKQVDTLNDLIAEGLSYA